MATGKNYPPNLELKMDESVLLTLVFDKCIEGTNTRGQYHLYRVAKEDGTEHTFSASEGIHNAIVAHQLKKGSQFLLKKVSGKNGLRGELVFEATDTTPEPRKENGYKSTMAECLRDAFEISRELTELGLRAEDVRAIALTLFIARTKQNGFA